MIIPTDMCTSRNLHVNYVNLFWLMTYWIMRAPERQFLFLFSLRKGYSNLKVRRGLKLKLLMFIYHLVKLKLN